MKDPITTVGLDIGSTHIRAVQVTKKKSGYVIDKVGVIRTPEQSVLDGEITDPKAVGETLKQLWKDSKFDTVFVKLGIGSRKVYSQLTEEEKLPEDIFRNILPTKLADFLPEEEEFYFDFHQISSYTKMEADPNDEEAQRISNKMQVVFAAIPQSIVHNLLATAKEAKLKPISIDLTPFALLRATSSETGEAEGGQISIDIGGRTTTVVISVAGQPRYTRVSSGNKDNPVGGRDITEAIAAEFNIPIEKAEDRKMEAIHGEIANSSEELGYEDIEFTSAFGSGGAQNQRRPVDEDERAKADRLIKARRLANNVISETIDDINSAITDFEQGQYAHDFASGDMTIHPTVLSGGVMGTKNIQERIERVMGGHRTTLAKPLSSRDFKKDIENEHEYTIAVGLAVGEGGSSK